MCRANPDCPCGDEYRIAYVGRREVQYRCPVCRRTWTEPQQVERKRDLRRARDRRRT